MKSIEKFFIENKIPYEKEQSLDRYTTLGIGGLADFVLFPEEKDITKSIEAIKNEGIPYYIIGGGSNLLISDRGFRGVIIHTKRLEMIELQGNILTVGAGARLGRVLAFMLKRGLSGMEGLIGIPGTVGGAVFGNAGSFGVEIKDCLEEIELIDNELRIKTLRKNDINFQYRKSGLPENSLIVKAVFKLRDSSEDSYIKMRNYLQTKIKSQPLTSRSAGCVFKNPEGTSAGYLIDKAGLKGTKIGDIVVSSIHANYFINTGRGSSSDFLKLMELVRERVLKVFSIELEPEIKFLEA
ncbi:MULTISPECIES: UDP-N-acetylmuramate dehydrogenase [Thermodesulfovibrio]|jgi:UDP-N-acetylmuramate dehydrogenase|uniref:UDP-N-acetylmuramate dehydrogenase n=1 Tax=Thermodesulfovibrio TaxID=28261 RepID=UPI0026322ABC|nr:UDP-N-acetylmuramate dehydrogenase [Thermodesulfovibrio sp.]